MNNNLPTDLDAKHKTMLWILSTATFLIFFQAFMIAPLIPRLSRIFEVPEQTIGLAVPSYMIAYGVATLMFGLLSDRLGRRNLMLGSLLTFGVLTVATATAQTATQFILWRLVTGLGAAGVVPLALAFIGAEFPFERRGRPLGWLFAAMAGGMAFGSSLGALAEPFIGWQGLFVAVGVASAATLFFLIPQRQRLGGPAEKPGGGVGAMLQGFKQLLSTARGRSTYSYVLLNSIFHGGVYTWLGLYFVERYSLGEVGIAFAIIGYGVPGFIFGPSIGRAADRWGRRWILPVGLVVSAAGAAGLLPVQGVVFAAVAVLVLSVGYDLTQPLLAGIVTALGGPKRGGQAMGLNVFILFIGFGIGSYLFGELVRLGLGMALVLFAGVELLLALGAFWLFRNEIPEKQEADGEQAKAGGS